METKEKDFRKAFLLKMDDDLKSKFKSKCAIISVNMNDMLVKLIENWVESFEEKD